MFPVLWCHVSTALWVQVPGKGIKVFNRQQKTDGLIQESQPFVDVAPWGRGGKQDTCSPTTRTFFSNLNPISRAVEAVQGEADSCSYGMEQCKQHSDNGGGVVPKHY